ncbi:hypothetical protein [Cohnella mopanensis]|uniref:hypothetical protein n=1 Tax=Cohnella mopanensis TaxID=2911966 RepID=UPI001EF7E75D|nr:hypothetical protein [Cohnella mopanensis]
MIDYRNRIDRLKAVEVLCYSLCIHLLTEELLAVHAAKAALLDLYKDEQFWLLEDSERDQRVRKQAIRRSLECLAKAQ